MGLTYSLIYTPNVNTQSTNFICCDHKIHFRFHDYNKEELINGFEKKLTYLMSYLFNYNFYIDALDDGVNKNNIIEQFFKKEDISEIYKTIYVNVSDHKFKGFKAFVNYRKKDQIKIFGALDRNCFPLIKNGNIYEKASLQIFLSVLNIDLKNYLFNDSYSILIHKERKNNINSKFINKQLKKQIKEESQSYEQLW